MNAHDDKSALRRTVRLSRRARSPEERDRLSEAACGHLLRLSRQLGAQRVAVFLSAPTEIDTRSFIATVDDGVTLFAPHSLPNGQLAWSEITADTPWHQDDSPVPEPHTPRESWKTDINPDLVIVPAAMVDSTGVRLGWGKGYYDRYLAHVRNGVCVAALVFDDEVVDMLPRESHDVPVSHVVTPSGTRTIGGALSDH